MNTDSLGKELPGTGKVRLWSRVIWGSCYHHLISSKVYALQTAYFEDILVPKYLKNHWIKHRLVCIQFDAFSTIIPNMDIIFNYSKIFKNFLKKKLPSLHSKKSYKM